MKYPLPSILAKQSFIPKAEYLQIPEYKGLIRNVKISVIRPERTSPRSTRNQRGSLSVPTPPIQIKVTNISNESLPVIISPDYLTHLNFNNHRSIIITSEVSGLNFAHILNMFSLEPTRITSINMTIERTRIFPDLTFVHTDANGMSYSRINRFLLNPYQQQADVVQNTVSELFGGVGSEINFTMQPNSAVTLDLFVENIRHGFSGFEEAESFSLSGQFEDVDGYGDLEIDDLLDLDDDPTLIQRMSINAAVRREARMERKAARAEMRAQRRANK